GRERGHEARRSQAADQDAVRHLRRKWRSQMKVDELRVLEADELGMRLRTARRELYELRFKHAVGQLENSSQISKVRHDIARIMTVIVQVGSSKAHRLYRKTIQQRTKFKVHDEKNECGVGDLVRITETRPISKEKRWRVLEIVEKAK